MDNRNNGHEEEQPKSVTANYFRGKPNDNGEYPNPIVSLLPGGGTPGDRIISNKDDVIAQSKLYNFNDERQQKSFCLTLNEASLFQFERDGKTLHKGGMKKIADIKNCATTQCSVHGWATDQFKQINIGVATNVSTEQGIRQVGIPLGGRRQEDNGNGNGSGNSGNRQSGFRRP